MKKNSSLRLGCGEFILLVLIVVSINIYTTINDFFEERKQEELNGLYLDYIDSIRPTLEPKLFTVQHLEQSDFYKKYKGEFEEPINEDTYDRGGFGIKRWEDEEFGVGEIYGGETHVYFTFYDSRNYRYDIMEKEFPHRYLKTVGFETESILLEGDKQLVADLLTTIGYPTTVKNLENVGTTGVDDEVQSQYIAEISDNVCYQQDAFYIPEGRAVIDGKREKVYRKEQSFTFECSFYPFNDVWDELEKIEEDFNRRN